MIISRICFAVVLAPLMLASVTNAHPGVRARDLKKTLDIASVCYETSQTQSKIYGYTRPTEVTSTTSCPKGSSLVLTQRVIRATENRTLNANNTTTYQTLESTGHGHDYQDWVLDYRLNLVENDRELNSQSLSEFEYQMRVATIQTVTAATPVRVEIDYAGNLKTAFSRPQNALNEHTLNVISSCATHGGLHLYTIERSANEECSIGAQLTVVSRPKGGNRTERDRLSDLIVRSRYDVELFKSELRSGTVNRLELLLKTASKATPVKIVVDTKRNLILDIQSSANPYAL